MASHPAKNYKTMVNRGIVTRYTLFVMFLVRVATMFLAEVFPSSALGNCDKQRRVLKDSYGYFSSGSKEYAMDSHCEWLIKANSTEQYITLKFLKMDTECSFDHVFVYDGDSYASPLLGSFSGNSTPSHVTASHGSMLILLYSDTNYVRTGFSAVYTITDCPLNCSEKGVCIKHRCICNRSQTGAACDIDLCPSNCEFAYHQGECFNSNRLKCKCQTGYSGMDCSLPESNKNKSNTWHVVSPDGFFGENRAGHSGIYIENLDILYIFGGYTFGKVLGDLVAFDFLLNQWQNLTVPDGPSPRRHHAALAYGNHFVLFGGELENGHLSNELWFFNTSSQSWKYYSIERNTSPPPVTKHSLTLVDHHWLYLFGGSLADQSFSSDMYKILLKDPNSWTKVESYGSKQHSRRLVGHTAVFYEPARSIFVYGGVTVEYLHGSRLNHHIYAFHVDKNTWTRINYIKDQHVTPLERAFHTAAIVDDYMVVFGGYTHRHSDEEICYDNETYLYHLKCHKWINFHKLVQDQPGSREFGNQGIFAHSMSVRRGHTLLIYGGYSGVMHSKLSAYVLPDFISGNHKNADPCIRFSNVETCQSNLACGWCSEKNMCMKRENRKTCSKFIMDSCPGLCSTLNSCTSCLLWGDPVKSNVISDHENQDTFSLASCLWYVQGMTCLPYNETNRSISFSSGLNATKWWDANETLISVFNDCYTEDFPPGLTSIKYRSPVNWSQPDDVSLLVNASEDFYFRPEALKNESSDVEENIVKFLAFIHPLGAKKLSERMSQVTMHMCSSGSSAILKLSNDATKDHLEVVMNHTVRSLYLCSNVQRPNGEPIFPDTSRGQKYLLDFTVNASVYLNETSMRLVWDAFSLQVEPVNYRFLEPYKNGSCAKHGNCLACLTDNECAWCEKDAKCLNRQNISEASCEENGSPQLIITEPNVCSHCSDFVYCEQCTQSSICEWLVESGYCVRRGRFKYAVSHPSMCPTPCHQRHNCSSCLGDPGICAWCETTETCFVFSTYTTSYMFGMCRDWVDENRSETNSNPISVCRDCTRHENCSQCLQDLNCGWCSYSFNPNIGVCMSGDFGKSSEESCLSQTLPISVSVPTESIKWSYETCPDVDECVLGLHDCHPNATCKNVPGSFICKCNVGFKGDGRSCVRACAHLCVNGFCSGAPDYNCVCELGWSGDDCSVNCGCNNHSSCVKGIGICDKCEEWTEGKFCEKCKPGSYGDALNSIGCTECHCNGHGSADLGYCNSSTGACFCEDHTEGYNCTTCSHGYYGDPRDGGVCFEECKARGVKTGIVKGRLGSSPESGPRFDCLWLLTVYPSLDVPSLLGPMLNAGAFIELVIHEDMKIPCPHNHVYVYDGLPDFIAPTHPHILLGSFCGSNLNHSLTVTATSGYLTIHFKRSKPDEAFSASYRRVENFLDDNDTCVIKNCDNDSLSVSLDKEPCPNNCSGFQNHGICNLMYGKCICENGYAGHDCSLKLKPYSLVWTSVYNYVQAIERNKNMPSGRIGHTLLAVNNAKDDFEKLWLFGGYSATLGYMNDMFMFETFKGQWTEVKTYNKPPARHFHSAVAYGEHIYIFGGMNEKKSFNDFWKFDTRNLTWSALPTLNDIPPLAGSTLTLVQDRQLLLIGGISSDSGFFDKVASFNLSNDQWSFINCTGAQPIGIYGHTSVYHADTESIYVFGGIRFDVEKVVVSQSLYAFHYPSKQWFSLPPDMQGKLLAARPLPMYFHSAVVTKNYMVVLGGRSSKELKGFPKPYAYVFSCNLWISLNDDNIEVVGSPPEDFVGGSAAVASGDAYFFGDLEGELVKLSTPRDFCKLFSASRVGCIRHAGCAFCSVRENGVNQTFCNSQISMPSSCYNPKVSSEVVPAVSCSSDWIEKRDCGQYTSCTDCVAVWPAFSDAKQVCQWCGNCKTGRCIPLKASCENANECNPLRGIINETSSCPSQTCYASDCDKCSSLGSCIWTSQVQRSSGFGHVLNKKPIYNWVCVMKEIQDAETFNISSMPPLPCPAPCARYKNCSTCLQSNGGEGGWHECLWSETLQSCLSPSFELIRCEDGSCGPVLIGNTSQCPIPCWYNEQASHCLANAHCGWCAFSGPKVDGRGLCIEGGIMGPVGGWCTAEKVLLLNRDVPAEAAKWLKLATGPPQWSYLKQPPENECENGHHTCHEIHEVCVDTPTHFKCECRDGYNLVGDQCKPICKQGCLNGTCTRPDHCECHFGYVGANCSIACKCNGHSNCPGAHKLDNCTECHNNTQGTNCQKCKPFFVGNPTNGGKCVPCHTFCHGHSSICLNIELVANNGTLLPQPYNQSFITELLEKVTEGATSDALCIDCQNNTEGNRCDQCVSGYFKAGDRIEDGCRPCECHGHGDICNPTNGENCNCQNNTENDHQCSQKNAKNIITPCWQLQCSKCKEYFLGAPAHGHQCYRTMFLDKDYCFDPNNQDKCNEKPYPLLEGRTVFFAAQPRYMNVDIRIVVDVTVGGIDFLLSAKEDTFVVDVNQTTGVHFISVDKKYSNSLRKEFEFIYHNLSSGKNKRDTTVEDLMRGSSNVSERFKLSSFLITEGNYLTTYVTIKKTHEFLLVRNLKNRLVITIPQNVHDLRSTRFYMILRGAGSKVNSSTYGSLFFRQDQTRIDLFVFFSVFFSCFFLFLAICVVVWKVKQAFDVRRARRLHAAEMKHMASRPFGHVVTIIDDECEDYNFTFYSPTNCRKKSKHSKVYGRDSPKANDDRFCLRPIAVEPLTNGTAAVATILVQLPGDAQSLVKMTLASALITARSSHYHVGCGIRAAMRRRTSHANV